jgi:hypothetical protein
MTRIGRGSDLISVVYEFASREAAKLKMISFACIAALREMREALSFSRLRVCLTQSREVEDDFLRVLRGFA